jgi:hypothetical protein
LINQRHHAVLIKSVLIEFSVAARGYALLQMLTARILGYDRFEVRAWQARR